MEEKKKLPEDRVRMSERERELFYLKFYAEKEREALEAAKQIHQWMKAGGKKDFPFTREQTEKAIEDFLEVLFWRCGGIRELFFSSPEYRMERMRGGNSPDLMELVIAEELMRLVCEEVTAQDQGDPQRG